MLSRHLLLSNCLWSVGSRAFSSIAPQSMRVCASIVPRLQRSDAPPPPPPPNPDKDAQKKGPITWKSVAVLCGAGAGILLYAEYLKQEKKKKQTTNQELAPIGKPVLGGPFVLVDAHNKITTTKDFQGKWLLIYFGFTFCPDICPNELAKITDVVSNLDKQLGPKVTPVFISIDPERDTPEKIGEYVKDFHPRFVALTGSLNQVSDVCKKFRVFYNKAPTGDGPMEYLVDHSIITYFVDPNGEFVTYYGKNKTVDEVTADIATRIKQSNF